MPDSNYVERGLGFIPGAWDRRNLDFPIRSAPGFQAATLRPWRYWYPGSWWGDQGMTSSCVSYAFTHYLKDGPVTQPDHVPDAFGLYREFQKNDPWGARSTDDGTTISAGAYTLRQKGFISSYYWTTDVDEIVRALLTVGPVVIGIPWYTGFYYPNDKTGLLELSGRIEGYHAILINGVNRITRRVRLKNSWGREWGKGGHCYMSFDTLAKVVADRWAESCCAVEVRLAA